MRSTTTRAATTCAIPCLFIAGLACTGAELPERCDAIVMDMPHGAWRIHVHPDGSGRYAYGALPTMGRIAAGTFEFEEVRRRLRRSARGERRGTDEPYGTVQFCPRAGSGERLWYFYDQELAGDLFDLAFESREGTVLEIERERLMQLDRIWAERRSPAQTSFEYRNGRWFDGEAFIAKTLYSTNGFLTEVRPEALDSTFDFRGNFVVPAFGDAHTHLFDGAGPPDWFAIATSS